MKRYVLAFVRRGLMAAAGGPVVLAIIYAVLGLTGKAESIPATKACIEILTITLMAFIAAGITTVYTVERLPLVSAILIHAGVLYLDYLMIYLVNGWIPTESNAFWVFTAVFAAGYALTWLCIYFAIRKRTRAINIKINARA